MRQQWNARKLDFYTTIIILPNNCNSQMKFRIRRSHWIAVLLWLLGVLLLYICSWPAYESMIPDDRKIIAISADGRYLATAMSPAQLVRTFSGRVEPNGRLPPRGPIEIWDSRGGTVVRSIDCGTDRIYKVHFMDRGNLIVAAFQGDSDLDSYVGTWRKGTAEPMKKLIAGRLMCCADVDGTSIAIVMEAFSSAAKVIDLRSGKELPRFTSGTPWRIVLSSDGSRVATENSRTEDGYTIQVLDTITGNQIASFLGPGFPKAWTLSRDGKTLWVVDVNDRKQQASLHGWDVESRERYVSITPPDHSRPHAMLMSAIDLRTLAPAVLQVNLQWLIRVHEESIDIVDADISRDIFSEDGSLQAAIERDTSDRYFLVVSRIVDRSEVFRLRGNSILEGVSPDTHFLAMRKKSPTNMLSAFRVRLSGLLHTPPLASSNSAREVYGVDLRDGSSQLVGIIPRQRFNYFEGDGFIDGGKRILINNYIWKFPGHRPWTLIFLLPSFVVLIASSALKRRLLAGARVGG